MRKGTFGGETIYLTDKEWSELLKRFDSSKAVKSKKAGFYEILGEGCYLCEKYRGMGGTACSSCPLNTEVSTCGDFMEGVVGGCYAFHSDVNIGVSWMKGGRGKEDVEKVHKALMNMERVKGRGK